MLKLKTLQRRKVRLGFYPYTYVRTVVMRTLLFKRDDYNKMLKMSFSEIAKFLQDSHYRDEINELATEYSGADLLERALNRNLSASFKKLIRISSEQLALPITEYLKRKDIEDIKTIIRGKFINADEKSITSSITAAGTLSYDFLVSLLKKSSVEEILKSTEIFESPLLEKCLKELSEKNTLAGIENALDKHYYTHLLQFSYLLPKEGALFRDFLLKEVDILNILTLFRLKKAKLGNDSIKDFIILSGNKKDDARITSLANAGDLEALSKALKKSQYKDIVEKGIEEFKNSGSLITLEIELYKYLLKHSVLLLHQHPLSIDVILGYMFAKDLEVRNLRIIVKGKQLGLSDSFIESQLVY